MFSTGQRVACINDDFPAWIDRIYPKLPVKDQVYTVRGIAPGQSFTQREKTFSPDVVIYLEEITCPTIDLYEAGFRSDRFAPLLDEKESIFVSNEVEEPALA